VGREVSEMVVGVTEVCVTEGGIEVGVLVPLQAATDSTSKSINRLMYYRLFVIYICSIRIHNIPRTVVQIASQIPHVLLHNLGRAKLNK
jgi:hypothetical protein